MNAAPTSLRLAFAGTPEFAVPALDALAQSRHRVLAVFTQPDRPAGRGRVLQMSVVKRRALALGLEVFQPASFRSAEATSTLRALELDALVVVAYGLILPASVLAIPRLGCFNIHASLLPRWRGAAPIQRALLAGDTLTGLTIMRMDAGLDTGPILARSEVSVDARDSAGSLHDRLAPRGGELLVDTLDLLAAGGIVERPQPQVGITYADKIQKAEARIDWREDALSIRRRVRAFNPWPVAETTLAGAQLRVWEAELAPSAESGANGSATPSSPGTVVGESNDGIDVACGRGVLRLQRLQLAGRKAIAAQEFSRSRRLAGSSFA